MMKWKVKKGETNIGTMELENLIFDEDCMDFCFDISNMSEELRAEVDRVIENGKVECSENRKRFNLENRCNRNTTWSEKPVIVDFTFLKVELRVGEPIKCAIKIGFHDAVDANMEQWDCEIGIDLSEYRDDLRKIIIDELTNKFF